MVFALLRKRAPDPVPGLYATIAAAARRPAHYIAHQVPDTVEGRFELLMLTTGLVVDRLNREEGAGREAGRRLAETFFDDMDRTLREIGIGDTTVPKKMKKIAQAFFGRLTALRAALSAPDPAALEQALVRNVYQVTGDEALARAGETAPAPEPAAVAAFAAHVRRLDAALAATPAETILAGGFVFPDPDQSPTDARP